MNCWGIRDGLDPELDVVLNSDALRPVIVGEGITLCILRIGLGDHTKEHANMGLKYIPGYVIAQSAVYSSSSSSGGCLGKKSHEELSLTRCGRHL